MNVVDKAKEYYARGWWTLDALMALVNKGKLTGAQVAEITGADDALSDGSETDYSQKFVGLSAKAVWQSLSYRPTKREYQQACDWLQIAYEPTATNAELRALLAAAAGIEE